MLAERRSSAPAPEQPVKQEVKPSRKKRSSWKSKFLRIAAVAMLWHAPVGAKPTKEALAQEELPKGKIVFVSAADGDGEIYTINTDGTELKQLTNNTVNESNPMWTPDGKRIRFESETLGPETALVMDTDGGNIQDYPPGLGELFPDGKKLLTAKYTRDPNDPYGTISSLVERNLETGEESTLFTTKGILNGFDLSSDGRRVAYSLYTEELGPFEKIFISSYENGSIASTDILPVTIEGPLIWPTWSPSGTDIAFGVDFGCGVYCTELYKVGLDGTNLQLLLADRGVSRPSWSPDGKFIVTTQGLELIVISAKDGELVKTLGGGYDPDWQPRVLPERVVLVEITGLTGEVSSGGGGFVKDSLFVELESRVRRYGIRGNQIVHFSWSGNEIRNNLHYPTEQKCTDTLTDPRDRALEFLRFTDSWHAVFPADHLVFVIHSEGIQPVLYGIDKARSVLEEGGTPQEKEMINDIRWDQMTIIGGQTAALGVDKPGVEYLPLLFKESSKDCKALFGQSPSPGLAFYPAATNLLNTWENRESRAKEIESDVRWFIENGGRLVGLGNYLDDILYIRGRAIPELGWEMRLLKNRVPEQVLTQEIPGAENHMLLLPRGHGSVYQPGPGLDLILEEFAKLTGN